ncbi:hypothetical protein FOZ63_021266, partial [Perkinsus olseni]
SKIGLAQFCRSLWSPDIPRGVGAANTLSHRLARFTDVIGQLSAKGAKANAKLEWDADMELDWQGLVTSMGAGVTHFHRAEDADGSLQFIIMVDSSSYAGAATLFRTSRPDTLGVLAEGGLNAAWGALRGLLRAAGVAPRVTHLSDDG